jgi:hypothetical protein
MKVFETKDVLCAQLTEENRQDETTPTAGFSACKATCQAKPIGMRNDVGVHAGEEFSERGTRHDGRGNWSRLHRPEVDGASWDGVSN